MASQQRDAVLQQRRQRWSQNHDDPIEAIPLQSCDNDVVHLRNSSVDSPYITQKLKQFHEKLFKLEAALCVVCLERFPTIKINEAGVCSRCGADTRVPKLYSAANNMDPGPLPPELCVSSYNNLILI